MLHQLCSKTIWRLKRHPVLITHDAARLKNVWEEFCWHNYGDSDMMSLWEDFVKATIAEQFEKLKEIDRFETWLETRKGEDGVGDFIRKEFDSNIPLEYLNIDRLCQEIWFDNGDVYAEVYKLLLEAANNYADLKEEWHYYD